MASLAQCNVQWVASTGESMSKLYLMNDHPACGFYFWSLLQKWKESSKLQGLTLLLFIYFFLISFFVSPAYPRPGVLDEVTCEYFLSWFLFFFSFFYFFLFYYCFKSSRLERSRLEKERFKVGSWIYITLWTLFLFMLYPPPYSPPEPSPAPPPPAWNTLFFICVHTNCCTQCSIIVIIITWPVAVFMSLPKKIFIRRRFWKDNSVEVMPLAGETSLWLLHATASMFCLTVCFIKHPSPGVWCLCLCVCDYCFVLFCFLCSALVEFLVVDWAQSTN